MNLPSPPCSGFSLVGKIHLLFIPMPISKLQDSGDPGLGLCSYSALHPSICMYHGYSSNPPAILGSIYPLSISRPTIHTFTPSLTCLPIHPSMYPSIHPPIHPSFHYSFIYFIHSFIHQIVLNTSYVPGTVISTRVTAPA